MAQKLDYIIIDLLESTARNIRAHPVNLGGVSGAGGGVGGPPGGFIGQLPQKRITYDTDEFAYSGIESVPSGSLVDNLAHIRFRLDDLESGSGVTGSGVIVIDDNESITYDPTTTIHLSGSGVMVTNLGGGEIRVTISGGGTPTGLDDTYLRLDTTNNPLTDQLQIINDNAGNGGIYIQTTDDAFTADFEQYGYSNNPVSSPILFLYRSPGDAGTSVFNDNAIDVWQDEGNGSITGHFLRFRHNSVDRFWVTVSGDAYSNGELLITEAPIDGETYGRQDGDWVTISGGAGSFPNPFALPADITPTALSADVNDYNPSGLSTADVLRLTSDTIGVSRTITGLQGGADGRVIIIQNIGNANLFLSPENTSSSAANRFQCPSGNRYEIPLKGSVVLQYDNTSSRWRVAAGTDAISENTEWEEQGTDPSTPSAGYQKLYFKTNGLYHLDSSGNVIGPLMGADGWIPGTGTWSYTSADAPSFVASVPDADAAEMTVGYRVKLTQTTVKYFIVTAKGTPSAGFTPVTFYGGTDYTLVSAAITSPYYSPVKVPQGFPTSPAKWTVTTTDTSDRSQVTTDTTVYNLGSISISAPIGAWRPKLACIAQAGSGATGTAAKYMQLSLSTANNTINTAMATSFANGNAANFVRASIDKEFPILTLTSKTAYYLTERDQTGNAGLIALVNSEATLYITLESAYL